MVVEERLGTKFLKLVSYLLKVKLVENCNYNGFRPHKYLLVTIFHNPDTYLSGIEELSY